ncbi:MAG: helix-turn-helix transcriptional regulator [Tepidisphaeraceae bacterium]|jgi:DNA-binding NarL/FixJ family response regulator
MAQAQSASLSSFLNDAAWERLAEKLKLSPREIQIVRAVFEDQKELVIARRLGMSPHTVHTHMDRLHSKLSVRGRSQLIIKVLTTFLLMTAEPDSPLPAICGDRAAGRCPLGR